MKRKDSPKNIFESQANEKPGIIHSGASARNDELQAELRIIDYLLRTPEHWVTLFRLKKGAPDPAEYLEKLEKRRKEIIEDPLIDPFNKHSIERVDLGLPITQGRTYVLSREETKAIAGYITVDPYAVFNPESPVGGTSSDQSASNSGYNRSSDIYCTPGNALPNIDPSALVTTDFKHYHRVGFDEGKFYIRTDKKGGALGINTALYAVTLRYDIPPPTSKAQYLDIACNLWYGGDIRIHAFYGCVQIKNIFQVCGIKYKPSYDDFIIASGTGSKHQEEHDDYFCEARIGRSMLYPSRHPFVKGVKYEDDFIPAGTEVSLYLGQQVIVSCWEGAAWAQGFFHVFNPFNPAPNTPLIPGIQYTWT